MGRTPGICRRGGALAAIAGRSAPDSRATGIASVAGTAIVAGTSVRSVVYSASGIAIS